MTDIVAIDGPAGAGKSTVSRKVAERLGYACLDSGAMYRAATWWNMHQGTDMDDPKALAETTRTMNLEMDERDGALRVLAGGQDVTEAIRTPGVTRMIRKLDGIPAVREQLREYQRAIGLSRPTVAEGRDMGTVVFPDARCKVFLDASLDARASRRVSQLGEKGVKVELAETRSEIDSRDQNDRNRETAPLVPAPDAHILDTTDMSLDEVVDRIVALVRGAAS